MANVSRHPADADLSPSLFAAQPGPQRKTQSLGRHAAGAGKTRTTDQRKAARLFLEGLKLTRHRGESFNHAMKVTRRKILFGVAMLMTLVIFLPVVVHFRMKATVEAYNSQLRAQGEMLTIAELIPLTPTNGPNRAAALLSAA